MNVPTAKLWTTGIVSFFETRTQYKDTDKNQKKGVYNTTKKMSNSSFKFFLPLLTTRESYYALGVIARNEIKYAPLRVKFGY
jgi:hypothetical protein